MTDTGSAVPQDGIIGWVTDLMEALGAPGAGVAIAAENLFPPMPSEIILPLAGFTASTGKISLAAVLIWTTVGSVVGAMVLYALGALLGRDRLRAIAAKVPMIDLTDIDKAEAWFTKHGGKAVFFGRMLPIVRSLISIPAGIERMRIPMFLLYTTLGSAIWNTIFVLAGYQLGEQWSTVEQYSGYLKKAVIAVVAIAVIYYVVSRIIKWRRRNRGNPETQQTQQTQQAPNPTPPAGPADVSPRENEWRS